MINARLLKSARQAIDAFDRSVLAFDTDAALLWGSDKAMQMVTQSGLDLDSTEFRMWLRDCVEQPVSAVSPCLTHSLAVQFIGFSAAREVLVKLVPQRTDSNEDVLRSAFNLTIREAEVLYWLTLGKTNRDISAILSQSARTVNKHLEQVFQKMGVDNRRSGAVLADRKLHVTAQ
ncbi:helix-turn-helix transcriptional regulator [Ruegeria sp. 2205SS24-7]|uniref:helix-turn-helix transcriptional regulator n=1 Tax=Ruegeria discodermiae TaxID=3064389 RepID=UPI0027409C5D|nr:helix-turn-helix transcriptional regulator [Ruegeria sp. 2205SS24-7]MDP5220202.1 helix-turn-helix transcriptional regulator [Ruegeria sp. 2205SS24-7]